MNKLYIITGPAGVGKSTISKNIASSLEKSVLIDGDDIYNQFVGGRISPWKENAPINLFWKNCISLINNYLKEDYNVVFNYIIKKDDFNYLKDLFKEYEIRFTVLLVDEKTIIDRDNLRPADCRMGERSLILLKKFIDEKYDDKYILNTSSLSIDETLEQVINNGRFKVERMNIDEVKTPEDVLQIMEDNITYGWKDLGGKVHLRNMENFRTLYRTSSLEETIENKFGTCVEQAVLMSFLLNKIGIKTKMYCARLYENEEVTDINKDIHMHCFVLYHLNDKVYHMEHSNWERVGIYEYSSEDDAIKSIKKYYEEKDGAPMRQITEFSSVNPNLSFRDLNLYINSLDNEKHKSMVKK